MWLFDFRFLFLLACIILWRYYILLALRRLYACLDRTGLAATISCDESINLTCARDDAGRHVVCFVAAATTCTRTDDESSHQRRTTRAATGFSGVMVDQLCGDFGIKTTLKPLSGTGAKQGSLTGWLKSLFSLCSNNPKQTLTYSFSSTLSATTSITGRPYVRQLATLGRHPHSFIPLPTTHA